MKHCLSDELLSMLVDGEAGPEAAAHARTCAACAARAEAMASISRALRTLPPAGEEASGALRATLRGLSAGAASVRERLRRAAIGIAAAVAAAAALFVAPEPGAVASALADDAVSSHLRYFAGGGGPELYADDPRALEAWLAEALGRPVEIPALAGARPVGARRCQLLGELAGAVIYETPGGAATLFVPAAGSAAEEACARAAGSCAQARDGQTVCVLPGAKVLVGESARRLCAI